MLYITTIKDIAKAAGVSTATVSHVMNKTRFVSDKLKKRVFDAIYKYNYTPNMLAGELRSRKTNTIGLVLPDIRDVFYAILSQKISGLLFKKGFNTSIVFSENNKKIEEENIITLRKKMVDGIIVIPSNIDVDHIRRLNESGMPLLILDRNPNIGINSAVIDSFKGGYKAARHLINSGHKLFGYIDRFEDHFHSIERRKGFFFALHKHNIKREDNFVVRCKGLGYENGYIAANHLLGQLKKPTAIFGYTDEVSLGILRACKDLGFDVPNDISVVGYNDLPISSYTIPRLTTIHYPMEEISKVSVDLITDIIINGKNNIIKNIVIPPNLVIRESTSKLKKI